MTVTPEQLQQIADSATQPEQPRTPHRNGTAPALTDVLDAAGITYREQPPDAAGITWYHLDHCPFHEDDGLFRCGVGQRLPDGPYAAKCFHNRGASKGWQDFKAALRLHIGLAAPHAAAPGQKFTSTTTHPGEPPPRPHLIRLADVEAQPVTWLWEPYIPRKKLTLVEGDPGEGKSYMSLAIAGAISTGGRIAGTYPVEQGTVLLLTAEDDNDDTIRPRLDALGADPSRVFNLAGVLKEDCETSLMLTPEGIAVVEQAIVAIRPDLVVIDPITGYLGGKIDTHRDNEVRAILNPLRELAARYNCAMVLLRHLNKGNQARVLYRGSGSVAFTALSRSTILVGTDPETPEQRVMVPIKANLGPLGKPQGFTITDGLFRWTGEIEITAQRLLAPEEERHSRAEAERFLTDLLGAGPLPARDVFEAGESQGISSRTLRRAQRDLSISPWREGKPGQRGGGRWMWELPASPTERDLDGHSDLDDQDGPRANVATLIETGHLNASVNGAVSFSTCPDCAHPLESGHCFPCELTVCVTCGDVFHGVLTALCTACRLTTTEPAIGGPA